MIGLPQHVFTQKSHHGTHLTDEPVDPRVIRATLAVSGARPAIRYGVAAGFGIAGAVAAAAGCAGAAGVALSARSRAAASAASSRAAFVEIIESGLA
jgi:hypothetical protein